MTFNPWACDLTTTGLGDANWKVRLEAVQSFSGLVDGFDDKVNVQALMQVLVSFTAPSSNFSPLFSELTLSETNKPLMDLDPAVS